jgi:manganese/zinc/iron transport system permease protein
MKILQFFTDPVLRAPTIGCMLMCFAAALVGVIVFLRKQSLLGESLSHAAYPGVNLGVILAGVLAFEEQQELGISIFIVVGAFLSALAGVFAIHFLEQKLKIRPDSALCFVLAAFFGIGLTLASQVQFAYSSLYRQIQAYLYGQAATMTDIHIWIYGTLSLLIVFLLVFLYKELQTITFDRDFAKSIGIQMHTIDGVVFVLIVLAVVVGIRSVGVVLMSAMLIAPAAAARQYTNKLYLMFLIASIFGLMSGFFGNYLSVEISYYLTAKYPAQRLALPTGPMIVIVASLICLFSLLFAPERGFILRLIRIARFRYQCICENLLKAIWRFGPSSPVTLDQLGKYQSASPFYLHFILWRLTANGWLEKKGNQYTLTSDGRQRSAQIVRLHRLWEVYLADYLGVGAERVHRNAEEMEHILTPELEQELTLLLKDPKKDPHQQPIPPREGL